MFSDDNTGTTGCFVPARFDHNYFWYSRLGAAHTAGEDVQKVATAAVGTKDGNSNEVNDTVSCYDSAFVQPDFHIVAGSQCIDFGVAGTRLDGSPITTDIVNGTRVKGAAADVGAFEKE